MSWWLPLGLALASLAGFALGGAPFFVAAKGENRSLLDHLYPMTVAFFIGYVGMALLPHALFEAKLSLLAFAAGVAVMAFLSRKVFHRDPCCEAGHAPDPLGWTAFLALSVCAVNDGILMGIIAPPWLSGLNLGMLFHKVTSSFALALALGHWRHRGGRLVFMGLSHALLSPIFFFAGHWAHGAVTGILEPLMGFSAGILTYTVLTGMLPHSGQMLKRKPAAWFGFSAALGLALYLGYLHRAAH